MDQSFFFNFGTKSLGNPRRPRNDQVLLEDSLTRRKIRRLAGSSQSSESSDHPGLDKRAIGPTGFRLTGRNNLVRTGDDIAVNYDEHRGTTLTAGQPWGSQYAAQWCQPAAGSPARFQGYPSYIQCIDVHTHIYTPVHTHMYEPMHAVLTYKQTYANAPTHAHRCHSHRGLTTMMRTCLEQPGWSRPPLHEGTQLHEAT